jgi:hypothetical protein
MINSSSVYFPHIFKMLNNFAMAVPKEFSGNNPYNRII